MDEQALGVVGVLPPGVLRANALEALDHCRDIVGFDVAHVDGLAALLREASHRPFRVGDLGKLDTVKAIWRVEERELALVAVVLAGNRTELRCIQPKCGGIEGSRRFVVVDDVGYFIQPRENTDALTLDILR